MRVLFIASDTNAVGGIQQYNRKFLNCLRLKNNDVTLVELKGGGFFADVWFVLSSFFKSITGGPEITICAHINYAFIGFFMKKVFGREYLVCTHGIDVWDIQGPLKRTALRGAKLITTVAEHTRDKIVSQLPEVKNRIYFLYNPVDGVRFMPRIKSPNLLKHYNLEGKKVILTIARLLAIEGYKGYDRVIEAMPSILRTVPNTVYLLVGKGDDAPRVKRFIEKLHIQESVIMAGYVSEEELTNHYSLADVFVMPSKAEGAPAVFIEALACGIPVIAGNRDGSGTPLMDGKLGLLVDPDSIDEIASAIVRVLTGNVEARLLDRNFLRREVLAKFGIDHFPARIDEVLRLMSRNTMPFREI